MEYKGKTCSTTPVSSFNFFINVDAPWKLSAKQNVKDGWPYVNFCVRCHGSGFSAETSELKIR
jgi:hypothetical protein